MNDEPKHYSTTLADVPYEDQALYLHPDNRKRLAEVMSKGYTQDGGPPKVRFGEVVYEGPVAELVFDLREIIFRLLASYAQTDVELNEADRRAGAAERRLAWHEDGERKRQTCYADRKRAVGLAHNDSFDKAWDLTYEAWKAAPDLQQKADTRGAAIALAIHRLRQGNLGAALEGLEVQLAAPETPKAE